MTLYERYNTGDDDWYSFYKDVWKAQSFTVGNTGTNENHNITSVKLLWYKLGNPGTVTVSIRATDVNGKPTGSDLTSGTLDGNDFTTDPAGLWYEVSLTPYGLSADTKYAIVVRALAGDYNNRVFWRTDVSRPTYTGGEFIASTDSGSTWTVSPEGDFMFEEYGTTAGQEYTHTPTDTMSISDSIATKAAYKRTASDTLSIADKIALTFKKPIADTMSIADSMVASHGFYHKPTDTMSISDAIATVAAYKRALEDTMNISDVIATAAAYKRTLTDQMDISDVVATAAAYARAIADTMNISDSIIASHGFYVALADTMDISDSVSYEEFVAAVAIRLRKRYVIGLKPARVVKVGRIGV